MSLLISFLYWNNRNPHLLWWETVEFHRCLRSEGESGKVQRGCLSETCWDAQRVTSAVQIDQNARPCQSWRARWFYDGVLTQWQFPWVWLANRNRVERALFRLQFPPKRLFRHFEPSIDIDYCARSRKRVFFFREVQIVLAVLKLWTSSSRPTGELERQLRKVCCCHVTWDECGDKSLFR